MSVAGSKRASAKCASEGANGTIQLRDHQVNVAHKLLSRHGLLAAHSTGTGKTITSAAAATCLLDAGIVDNVVVLAKKSALTQFESEVRRFWQGSRWHDAKLACVTHVSFFRSVAKYAPQPQKTFLIVDEVDEFVNPDASSTQQLIRFAATVGRLLLLTATPITNTLYDFVPLISMVRGTTQLISQDKYESTVLKSTAGLRSYFHDNIDLHIVDKDKDPHYPRVETHRVSIPMSQETAKVRCAASRGVRYQPQTDVVGIGRRHEWRREPQMREVYVVIKQYQAMDQSRRG
jgi:hypothetical protein